MAAIDARQLGDGSLDRLGVSRSHPAKRKLFALVGCEQRHEMTLHFVQDLISTIGVVDRERQSRAAVLETKILVHVHETQPRFIPVAKQPHMCRAVQATHVNGDFLPIVRERKLGERAWDWRRQLCRFGSHGVTLRGQWPC